MEVGWVGIINETKLAIGYESLNRFCREARGPQQQEEIAPDQIALLQRPRILALFTAHSSNLLSWGLVWFQDKVKTFRALVLYSPSKHILCFTLLNVQCACVWLIERNAQTNVKQELCPNLRFCGNLIRFMAESLEDYTDLLMSRGTQWLLRGSSQRWMKHVDWTLLSWSNFLVSLTIS